MRRGNPDVRGRRPVGRGRVPGPGAALAPRHAARPGAPRPAPAHQAGDPDPPRSRDLTDGIAPRPTPCPPPTRLAGNARLARPCWLAGARTACAAGGLGGIVRAAAGPPRTVGIFDSGAGPGIGGVAGAAGAPIPERRPARRRQRDRGAGRVRAADRQPEPADGPAGGRGERDGRPAVAGVRVAGAHCRADPGHRRCRGLGGGRGCGGPPHFLEAERPLWGHRSSKTAGGRRGARSGLGPAGTGSVDRRPAPRPIGATCGLGAGTADRPGGAGWGNVAGSLRPPGGTGVAGAGERRFGSRFPLTVTDRRSRRHTTIGPARVSPTSPHAGTVGRRGPVTTAGHRPRDPSRALDSGLRPSPVVSTIALRGLGP